MDAESQITFSRLIRSQRVAALGTLRDGGPQVSMVVYAVSSDFSAFWIHLSRLAFHTQNILKDPRIGLMIAEPDKGGGDPQTLSRLSISGEARPLAKETQDFAAARSFYLGRFPEAIGNFELGDFDLYRIEPKSARFVAGFGRIFNLGLPNFLEAAAVK
jgi:putative heme iron utilization protein